MKDRRRTSRTTMAGWTVYVIEDPDLGRTNVIVRAQPWKRGADNTPAFKTMDAVSALAILKAQQWCETHPAGDNAEAGEDGGGSTENCWSAWEPGGSKPTEADLEIVQVQEARKILGAEHCRTQSELKRRLVVISQTEHPDRGGNPERWRKLHGAYLFLFDHMRPELGQSYDPQ